MRSPFDDDPPDEAQADYAKLLREHITLLEEHIAFQDQVREFLKRADRYMPDWLRS